MGTSEIVVTTDDIHAGFQESQIDLIRRTIMHKDATDQELQLFLYQAQRTGLDPLSRQIHAIFRWNKSQGKNVMTVQTSIDGYRLIADRTGKYAGSDDYLFDDGMTQYQHIMTGQQFPRTATVTVYKIVGSIRVPFTATAEWNAYCPSDNMAFMWKKMPYLMLGKCAEALALRKAFPAELSGLYTTEEMEQAGDIVDVEIIETKTTTNKKKEPQSPPPPEKKKEKGNVANARPYTPEIVKEKIKDKKTEYLGMTVTDIDRQRVAASLKKALDGDDQRYIVLNWLVGKESTKDISHEGILSLKSWLGLDKNSSWEATEEATEEALLILKQAMIENGELEEEID